jgi:hypothetical protein
MPQLRRLALLFDRNKLLALCVLCCVAVAVAPPLCIHAYSSMLICHQALLADAACSAPVDTHSQLSFL